MIKWLSERMQLFSQKLKSFLYIRIHLILDCMRLTWHIQRCRFRQKNILARIKHTKPEKKIRVLFLCSEVSKWKCQTVYEKMAISEIFEPIVGITALGEQSRCSDEELSAMFEVNERFFDGLGDRHVRVVTLFPRKYDDLKSLNPDIVFFPGPWNQVYPQTTKAVSHFALTCYVPYYVPTHIETTKHCLLDMHRFLTWYFVPSIELSREYKKHLSFFSHAYQFVPEGHPALDSLSKLVVEPAPDDGYVIYAPHFSFFFPKGALSTPISTFLETGIPILHWAQKHPEIKWAFKPHPKLRSYLVETGYWTQREVDVYWESWENISKVCYDGNYRDLFSSSRVLITDCDSFLAEYGVTGRPVIHLVRHDFNRVYATYLQSLIKSFYTVNNLKEMIMVFEDVLIKKRDLKRKNRLMALNDSGLLGVDAARNIVNYLCKELRR